jgi:hypothetical protein
MNIQDLAREAWTEQDVKDMLCNIMDIAKGGSLRHAGFVFKVLTYEPKKEPIQLSLPFEQPDYSQLTDDELRTLASIQSKIRVSKA